MNEEEQTEEFIDDIDDFKADSHLDLLEDISAKNQMMQIVTCSK